MKFIIRKLSAVIGLIAVLSVQAAPLPAPFTGPLTPQPDPVGGVPIASMSVPFSALTFGGTLVSTVWAGDLSNPFGPGALTFTYQLSNDALSGDPIDRFTLSSYAGFLVDASYQSTPPFGPVVIPSGVVRNLGGNQVSFDFEGLFAGTLVPGSSSPVLVLQTDSTSYQNSIAGVINSSTVNVATFAPLAVPEPASAALVILGAVALTLRRRQ